MESINQQDTQINVNRAVALVVTKHYLPSGKSVKNSAVDVKVASGAENIQSNQPDKGWLYVGKTLLKSPKLNAIYAEDEKVLWLIERLRIPSPLKGTKLFPEVSKAEIDAAFMQHCIIRSALTEDFLTTYPDDVAAAEPFLGDLFNLENYPTIPVARENFEFTWRWINFGISTELEDGIQQLLRASCAELVTELTEKLTPSPDGKRKIIRESSLNSIRDFLATFNARNITNDAELAATVDTIRKLTSGINPEDLRSNEAIRDAVQKGFTDIKASMVNMVVDAPVRKVRF